MKTLSRGLSALVAVALLSGLAAVAAAAHSVTA